jgi:hypothetical protein
LPTIRGRPGSHRYLCGAGRRGEIRRGRGVTNRASGPHADGLNRQDVDFDRGLISVEHSWDRDAGLIEPKSRAGVRRVPIPSALRTQLFAHLLRRGRPDAGFVFVAADQTPPFDSAWATAKARRAWQAAGLAPIGLHECRHYAAYAIAAGINPKALSSYMGHSSITVTLDRYGHLMPGNEAEAASMLDTYLHRVDRSADQTNNQHVAPRHRTAASQPPRSH